MSTLKSMIQSAPKEERQTCSVDVSDVFGVDDDGTPVHFIYQEPFAPELCKVSLIAKDMRAQEPEWAQSYAFNVAILACCHLSPDPGDNANLLYFQMAQERPRLISRLIQEFCTAFPDVGNFEKAADEKKGS